MPQDESPYGRDVPPIGQGVLGQAKPANPGTATKVFLVVLAFVAFVLVVAYRHAIVKAFSDPRTAEEKAAAEAARAVKNGDAPPTDTCGTLNSWEICVTGVKRKARVANEFTGYTAGKGQVYLMVSVEISHSQKSQADTFLMDFDLADADGNRYSTDDDAMMTGTMGNIDTCGMLGDSINPRHAVNCWLIFYMTKGTPGLHLVVRDDGKELRLSLGETAKP